MSRRAYRNSASTPIPAMPPPWRCFSKLATACPDSSITCAEAVARLLVPDGLVPVPQERPGERRFTYCDHRVIWGTHAPGSIRRPWDAAEFGRSCWNGNLYERSFGTGC